MWRFVGRSACAGQAVPPVLPSEEGTGCQDAQCDPIF